VRLLLCLRNARLIFSREDIRTLTAMTAQMPTSLGYFWETGELEDHIRIDDGLEKPFFLPLTLCSTPQVSTFITINSFIESYCGRFSKILFH
jgi:hypothetical protein